jgi:Ni/Co efflux regulator RcnB
MKKLFGAALALTLLGTTAAVAQPGVYDRYDRGGIYDNRGFDRNFNDRRGFDRPDFNWRRGMFFRNHRHHIVNDWWRHNLRRPNRNQHWVQHGNVFLLVNLRGMVVDVEFRPGFGRRW